MPIVSGGGAGGPAAGSYLPVADKTGVTVDTTTYDDPFRAGQKLTTLVFPRHQGALAIAITGDAFPRWAMSADPGDGLFMSDGTYDPASQGNYLNLPGTVLREGLGIGAGGSQYVAARMSQVTPLFVITSGALPTQQLVTATGAQISTSRDVETVTPFTGDGTNNAATCAMAISPDNLTYSTVATISIAAALNLTGVLTDTVNARVPAGWYLKLTVSHGTLGLTTYY